MTPLLLLLMQVGPAPTVEPISPVPEELQEQRRLERAKRNVTVTIDQSARLVECLENTRGVPETAAEQAQAWLDRAVGAERGDAGPCLGVALAQQGEWRAAADAFAAARDATDRGDAKSRALRGALAGGALLSAQDAARALPLLEAARTEAQVAGVAEITGQIALDRSLALVALGRGEDAGAALAEARAALPDDPQTWLLSATLARRTGTLDEAQQQIERAAQLAPRDPAVGLEAGVIAALAGRDEAARKSFAAVIELAPDSDQAETARGYLAQLGSS